MRGVKGDNCLSVTAKINKQLGEVVATKATQEMYEQEVQISVDAEAEVHVSEGWGASSWGNGEENCSSGNEW